MNRYSKIHNEEDGKDLEGPAKVKLVQTVMLPVMLYGSETWTLERVERKKVDAFELWCWMRLLRVSWTQRKTNILVLNEIPQKTLESQVITNSLS